MKKTLMLLIAPLLVVFVHENLNASRYAAGVQLGYYLTQGDYDVFDNGLTGGCYLRTPPFLFNTLHFQPGVNWLRLGNEQADWADVVSVNFDFYWYILGTVRKPFQPFLGAGAAFNIFFFENEDYRDSDSGLEAFAGGVFMVQRNWGVKVEARYAMHDISRTRQDLIKLTSGIQYNF